MYLNSNKNTEFVRHSRSKDVLSVPYEQETYCNRLLETVQVCYKRNKLIQNLVCKQSRLRDSNEQKLQALSYMYESSSMLFVLLCCIVQLPAALRAAQICRYLVYSEADFEVFRPAEATRCTDGGEIWHGGGDRRSSPSCRISPPLRSPPPCQISPPSVQRQGCRTPKIEIFTQI